MRRRDRQPAPPAAGCQAASTRRSLLSISLHLIPLHIRNLATPLTTSVLLSHGRLPPAAAGRGASRLLSVWHHKWPRLTPRRPRRSTPPSWRPPPRRQGMVTHDKCCLIRHCQVQLRWSRQPYRFRPRTSDDLLDETSHREGSHETLLADTAAIPAHGGRGTAMGSGVPIPAALDDTFRTVRRALAISHTTDGGDT
jgi:hypothetical protein